MKQPDTDVSFIKEDVYDETSQGTYEALIPYLRNPEQDKEAIVALLKLDYKLIHLLTKRYNMT